MKVFGKGKFGYLAQNTILFTISSFGSKLLTFLLVPLYTHILSTEEYGIADLIITTSNLFLYVVTICIADAVMRYVMEVKIKTDEILRYGARISVIGCSCFAVVLLIFSHFNITHWPQYSYLFLILHLFLSALNSLCSNYLRATDKIWQVSVAGIITTIVTIICNIYFLLVAKIGIIGYMLSLILGISFSLLYEVYYCGKIQVFFKGRICDISIRKEMIRYSVPLVFNGVGWWVNSSIDKYFISSLCSVAVNGIYSVAYKIPMILTTCQQIFSQAWSLSAIREFDKNDEDGFYSMTYNTYNVFLIVICSVLIFLNIPIADLLFAKDFFEAWKCSSFLLISMVFSALSSFLGGIISATKKNQSLAASTIISAVINILLNLTLIPSLGALGAAFATAISFFVLWIIRLISARKYIKWKMNIRKDLILYLLLFLQAFAEQTSNHLYIVQFGIIVILVFLNRKCFIDILKRTVAIIKK